MEQKVKYSQDDLRKFFRVHNIKVTRLGELIGQSDVAMANAFNHNIVNGKPHKFPPQIIRRINEALPQMAEEIAARLVTFKVVNDTENDNSKRRKKKFDKDCVPQFQRVGEYFNLTAILYRLLGWNKRKKNDVICTPSSKVYGHITEEEVRTMNTEILAVAGVLAKIEIAHDEADRFSSSDTETIS